MTTNGATVSNAFKGENLFEGDAGNATLIANGGSNGGEGGFIQYRLGSTGGTARVEVLATALWTLANTTLRASRPARLKAAAWCFLAALTSPWAPTT